MLSSFPLAMPVFIGCRVSDKYPCLLFSMYPEWQMIVVTGWQQYKGEFHWQWLNVKPNRIQEHKRPWEKHNKKAVKWMTSASAVNYHAGRIHIPPTDQQIIMSEVWALMILYCFMRQHRAKTYIVNFLISKELNLVPTNTSFGFVIQFLFIKKCSLWRGQLSTLCSYYQ